MSIFGDLFGGGHYHNPADAANPYLQQIPGTYQKYLNPYLNEGNQDLGTLHNQLNYMMQNPNAFYDKMASGFHHSPGYNYQLNQGENAINHAAAAGGMLGTPQHQQQAGQMAGNLANQDFNTYMNRVSGYFNQGLGGLSGLENQGFGAANNMANSIAEALGQQAQNAYAGAENENAHHAAEGNALGGLIGDVGGFLGGFL